MTPARLRNLTEATPVIRVAIVCAPETDVLAESIEELLAETKGFTCSRTEYTAKSGLKPHAAGFSSPDVVVATLGAFEATNTGLFLASLQRAFPHRSVLVTTTHPDTFDFLRVLEMGASDFLLPPVRGSELVARLMRHARVLPAEISSSKNSRRISDLSTSSARAPRSSIKSNAYRDSRGAMRLY